MSVGAVSIAPERQPETLAALMPAVRSCRICADHPARSELPHSPNPIVQLSSTARICIASQAPGTRAHLSSVPFNDASGVRLRAWLGLMPDRFYDASVIAILPMGFCFPGQDAKGGDLPPRRECAAHWRSRILGAMPRLELVLAIGQYAQAWHLGARRKASLTETVAAWRDYAGAGSHPKVVPLPHPSWRNSAWIKRHPWFERELLPFVRREVAAYV